MILLQSPRTTTLYKLAGTETFRASSSKFFGYGGNLQNIEKSARGMYWADDGKVLVQVDQSGAEALIVSYLCRPGKYRELFLNSVKPHVFVAMNVFLDKWKVICKDLDVESFVNTPIAELKKKQGWNDLDKVIKSSDNWSASERYYFIAKMIVHASSYGMKGPTFQLNVLEKSRGQVVLTKSQADHYLMGFHSVFPEIHEWHNWVLQELRATGCLRNLFGFPRPLTGVLDDRDYKEWLAFCPQSTVGCITHIACAALQKFIQASGRDWDLLGNCHDSYLAQCPAGEEKELTAKMLEFMCQDLTSFRGEKFRMKAEAQIGRNWAPQKESNPEGLVEVKL